ncbi:MAG: GNAT family N-acetyltransferase, partial [Oscillospiraceae bacterium]|nr:GNAT family N-acetyltransferase [Oscillospiraceae bacterium]
MTGKIRFATEKDAEAILKIYAPYIEKTAITFEYEVPSLSEFSKRIAEIQKKYPWIV